MHDKRLTSLLAILLIPTLTLAAGVATPPMELAEKLPETTLWLFGTTLGAMVVCVWLIAKMFSKGIDKSIQHSKEITQAHIDESGRINDAQWAEIRNLTKETRSVSDRILVIETDYQYCCGDRRSGERRKHHEQISKAG